MKRLISAALCLCLLLTFFVVPAQAEEAKIATDDTTGLENFWTLKGAALRLSGDETAKLRFETVFEKDYLDGLVAQHGKENVRVGTIVTPLNNLKRAGRVFTIEALEATGIENAYRISKAPLDAPLYETEDTYTFAGYSDELVDCASEYAAIGFVQVNGEITYSPTYTFRSVNSVTTQAFGDVSAKQTEEYAYPVMTGSWGNASSYSCYSDAEYFMILQHRVSNDGGDRILEVVPKVSEKDIRVVSSNVYFHCFKPMGSEAEKMTRVNLLANTLAGTGADVLLLQEVSGGIINNLDFDWQGRLFPVLETLGYTMVDVELEELSNAATKKGNPAGVNYTPIFYNADRLILKDCGHNFYKSVDSCPDSYLSSSKSYTWALFEEKESGKQFITITTHLTYHGIADIANMLRVQDAKEVVALKAELETKYAGVPMMIMGDLNCTVSSEPYNVLTEAGFRNAKDKAVACVNSSFRTSHSVGSAPTTGNGIDHALVLGEGLNIRMHQTYLSQNVFDMSDHIPVGIDFTFQ